MSLDVLEPIQGSEALSNRQWQPRQAPPPRSRRLNFYSDITSTAKSKAVPFGAHALVFDQPVPSWSDPLLMDISELGDLQSGWDSYGAKAIDPACAATAAEFILNLLDQYSPKPAIVPTSRGGIQLEWHRGGADLEIRIESPVKFQVWFEDDQNGQEEEFTLSDNLFRLLPLLQRISTGE